jgi:CheY-like chemotaxis protein
VPLKAVRMPDEAVSPTESAPISGSIIGEVLGTPDVMSPAPVELDAKHMRVLVAEDDPINSKIVEKRLKKLDHNVYLTVNGEECASAFCDKPRDFDVILMDMQMPIVDGLTSTKMIRSYEKTHTNIYSPRSALCGRVPIIAVSASLIEKDRQRYIDAGFDAWILKPIPFDRLNTLMEAIVDTSTRTDCLYQPGSWERGGWFHLGQESPDQASTKPTGEAPMSNPSKEAQKAAQSDEPAAGQVDSTDERDIEHQRLLHNQEVGKTEAPGQEDAEQPPS